jgi:hypothetical protein
LRTRTDPLGIAAGSGGDIWFADSAGAIGRVTAAGRITELSRGLNPHSSPVAIAAGADGNLWFTDDGSYAPALGRVTPRGRITEFAAGLQEGSLPAFIAPAPDGNEWFTDEAGLAALGRIFTGARSPGAAARPLVTGNARAGGQLTCHAPGWPRWARRRPSPRLFSFDGYTWLRDGRPIAHARARAFVLGAGDVGRRVACRVTVTYPAPLLVTETARSAAIRVRP